MKSRLLRLGSLLFLAVLFLAGCSASGGVSPDGFTYSGSWRGTIHDSLAGSGSLSASMSQTGRDIVGTWSATFPDGTGGQFTNGGSLAGKIEGTSTLLQMYPSNPTTCPFNAVVTRNGARISGDYAAFNCIEAVTGTVSLTKQ